MGTIAEFGASDNLFPRLLDPFFLNDQDGDTSMRTSWPRRRDQQHGLRQQGNVVDADPRIISNLIVDQTSKIRPRWQWPAIPARTYWAPRTIS